VNWEYGRRDPSYWPRGTLYPHKLAITSPTYSSLADSGHEVQFSFFIHSNCISSYVYDLKAPDRHQAYDRSSQTILVLCMTAPNKISRNGTVVWIQTKNEVLFPQYSQTNIRPTGSAIRVSGKGITGPFHYRKVAGAWSWLLISKNYVDLEQYSRGHQLCSHLTVYGTSEFITAFIIALHLLLSRVISIQSSPNHRISPRSTLILLSIHRHLGLPSGLFPSGFPTNNPYAFPLSIRATCPAYLILLDLIIQKTSISFVILKTILIHRTDVILVSLMIEIDMMILWNSSSSCQFVENLFGITIYTMPYIYITSLMK
jgi:hypothetical protein